MRYFDAGDDINAEVKKILRAVLGDYHVGPTIMNDVEWPLGVWYDFNAREMQDLDLRWCVKDRPQPNGDFAWYITNTQVAWHVSS
jgi:hypothetical protein